MFVAASTECFSELSLPDAVQRLVDLEYNRIEIALDERGGQLKPSEVLADLNRAVEMCRNTQRLTPVAFNVHLGPEGPGYYEKFTACCKLAKAIKVVVISLEAGELGTPFNAEIERLRELVRIATLDGVVVAVKTEVGHMTEDPTTAASLCDNVKGLALALDPSHYIYHRDPPADYDKLLKYVAHTHLRDSNKDKLQVRVGQGQVEYGRLITQLSRFRYNRALCVNIVDDHDPDIDHFGELRKMRLLLESLL